ncbi:PEBP-like protein [Xylariaceae sp. FL1272]|nr:PEBP-like protein [Xylariaceae sp. FL1272]
MGVPVTSSVDKAVSPSQDGANLRLAFPTTTVTKAATNLTKEEAKTTPTLSIAASALKQTPGTKYIAAAIDLDAPFTSVNFLSPILHGLHADLVAGPLGDDGFAPLQGTTEWMVPYIGPGPPPPSGPHRYVFLVFEQPKELDTAKIKSKLGFGEAVGMWPRIRWDQVGFEKKLGLGEALTATYFLTKG